MNGTMKRNFDLKLRSMRRFSKKISIVRIADAIPNEVMKNTNKLSALICSKTRSKNGAMSLEIKKILFLVDEESHRGKLSIRTWYNYELIPRVTSWDALRRKSMAKKKATKKKAKKKATKKKSRRR